MEQMKHDVVTWMMVGNSAATTVKLRHVISEVLDTRLVVGQQLMHDFKTVLCNLPLRSTKQGICNYTVKSW